MGFIEIKFNKALLLARLKQINLVLLSFRITMVASAYNLYRSLTEINDYSVLVAIYFATLGSCFLLVDKLHKAKAELAELKRKQNEQVTIENNKHSLSTSYNEFPKHDITYSNRQLLNEA